MMKNDVPASFIRYPGGCWASFYNWRDGIGDPYRRPVEYNNFYDPGAGQPVLNDFGLFEFMALCGETKAQPLFCVPLMMKPVENAVELVAFCNSPHHPVREKYGRKEPLNIKYFEFDNEMYRTMDALTYAQTCKEFAIAMKAVDPTIKVLMGDYYLFNPKLKEMLEIAGPYIDLVNNRGGKIKEQAADLEIIRAYNKKHNRQIQMCFTEFRAPRHRGERKTDGLNKDENAGESRQSVAVTWEYALNTLDQLVQYQNFGGDYAFVILSNYNDTWGENLINCAKEGAFFSATGRAMQFLYKLPISYPVEVAVANPDKDILVQAAWNADKTKFTLMVVNYAASGKGCEFDLTDLQTKFSSTQTQLSVFADKMEDYNSPADLNKIKSVDGRSGIDKATFSVSVKPFSANAWIFEKK